MAAASWARLLGLQRVYQPLINEDEPGEPTLAKQLQWFATRRKKRVVLWLIFVVTTVALALGVGWYYRLLQDPSRRGPVVDLGYARYRGNHLSNGVSEFLQMRFAQAPTGDLRWRAPVEPEASTGIQQAKRFGPICLGVYQVADDLVDEDCLYVNVWAPTGATPDSKLPVMVFVQGGGYTLLANANWNGSQLVETSEHNVIFVNFNYRVGLWGFLAGEEVKNNGDVNAGLLDQRFVLQWVQKHISQFGGDPGHVILHGVSAGAGSVALHLTAYGGKDEGLFAGVIAESVFFPAQPRLSDLEWQFDRTVAEAGCDQEEDKMQCLRSQDGTKLQLINHSSPLPGQDVDPLFYWTPCIDGDFMPDYPYNLYERGEFIKVPILFGACSNEGSVFVPNATTPREFRTFMQTNYPQLQASDTKDILKTYPLEPALPEHARYYPSASRAYGEATFICPTTNLVNYFQAAALDPTSGLDASSIWGYRYDVQDDFFASNGYGVPHVFEAPAVVGPAMLPDFAVPASYWSYNAPMVPLTMRYWLSFVRTFDPNPFRDEGAPEWENWGVEQKRMLFRLDNTSMETVGNDQRKRCEFWKTKVEVMEQ